jgi:hypothetical protein
MNLKNIKKIIITERQLKLLNEELHISDEVKVLTKYISNHLASLGEGYFVIRYNIENYKKYLKSVGYNDNQINKYTFFNTILVSAMIYNYSDIKMVSGYGETKSIPTFEKNNFGEETISIKSSSIDLHLGLLNGKPYSSAFYEPIQHEISHIFQRFQEVKSGYPKASDNTYRNFKKYEIAKENIKNKNWYISTLFEIYYYLNRSEQSAYTNGLYSILINTGRIINNLDEFLRNTFQYKKLFHLKEIYNNIDTWEENSLQFIEAKKLFFKPSITSKQAKSSVKVFLHNEIPNFEGKLNGVVRKYKKDIKMTPEQVSENYFKKFRPMHYGINLDKL